MIKNSYVAGFTALIMLFGHIGIFLILYSLSIPPDARQDVINLITPVTVTAFVSATLYVIKRKNIPAKNSDEVNYLFAIFVSVVPLVLLAVICTGLWQVDSRQDIESLKSTIATAEAFFGGVFVLLIDAVFGQSDGQNKTPKDPKANQAAATEPDTEPPIEPPASNDVQTVQED